MVDVVLDTEGLVPEPLEADAVLDDVEDALGEEGIAFVGDEGEGAEDGEGGEAEDADSPWLEDSLTGADGFDFVAADAGDWDETDPTLEWGWTDTNPVGVEITLDACEGDVAEADADGGWTDDASNPLL